MMTMDDDENHVGSSDAEISVLHFSPTSRVSLLLAEQKKILHVSGEERNQRERLLNTQGEFLNPIVAQRMRAKNNPYRQTELTELGECLEDHLMTCKWLITMVTKSLLATYSLGWPLQVRGWFCQWWECVFWNIQIKKFQLYIYLQNGNVTQVCAR